MNPLRLTLDQLEPVAGQVERDLVAGQCLLAAHDLAVDQKLEGNRSLVRAGARVTVAVDSSGTSVHNTGPAEWEKRIREFKIPLAVA